MDFDELGHMRATSATLNAVQAHLARIAMAWPLRLGAPDPDVDRCRSLLSGPLFVSAAHPWPLADGRWLEPVVQVDLAWLGGVGGRAVGAGLAQVWTSDCAAVVRVVPLEDVHVASLLPPPSQDGSAYHCRTRCDAEDGTPSWLNEGRAILGVEAPFLDCDPGALDYLLGEALAEPLTSSMRVDMEQVRADVAEHEPQFVHRAFGMASGVTDAANLPPVLLTIEEDRMIGWGDGGSGHLCLDTETRLTFHSF